MREVGVHEAKTQLSKLLRRVELGEEIVIVRSGKPVARLIAAAASAPRRFGIDRGRYTVPDDFDDTPGELIALFEGEDADPARHARVPVDPDGA